MSRRITGATMVAGIVGFPVRHAMSPILHNAWLEASGLDGVYVAFAPDRNGFGRLVEGFRGGAIRGLNVTIPFKEEALACAEAASERALAAGAANLLTFEADGTIVADNTDGLGMLKAFEQQAPGFSAKGATVTILGAGGGARGAASAFALEGAAEVRLVNRTIERAEAIAGALNTKVRIFTWTDIDQALDGADALVNATSLGLEGGDPLDIVLDALPITSPVMDMVYKPLETPLLKLARSQGRPAVDGLAMLIAQAVPSYQAFFKADPPGIDVRLLAIRALGL
jgi:shikimate dehydrogenase